jgi:hypothetical protein
MQQQELVAPFMATQRWWPQLLHHRQQHPDTPVLATFMT